MTIRNRLLLFLLPPLLVFVCFASASYFWHWKQDIIAHNKAMLESTVISCAQLVDTEKHGVIERLRSDSQDLKSTAFQEYSHLFHKVKNSLPITNLYTVRIKPVQQGEPVLLNRIINDENPLFDGIDPRFAYRQVYVLDARENVGKSQPAFTLDFCQCNEHTIYYTRKVMVSPIYKNRKTKRDTMSAFAPLIDKTGQVTALVVADVDAELLTPQIRRALMFIVAMAVGILVFAVGSVFFIAQNISRPVQQLNASALSIASGSYEESIRVKGPKEIVELANTLGTMSACLKEHLLHIQEHALVRERLYGEQECALLLQKHSFELVVKKSKHPYLAFECLHFNTNAMPKGSLLKIDQNEAGDTTVTLHEAARSGFQGIYQLIAGNKAPKLSLHFTKDPLHLRVEPSEEVPAPFVWSSKNEMEKALNNNERDLEEGDILLVTNHPLSELFEYDMDKRECFSKIFKHFASEGLEMTLKMLKNELEFYSKDKQFIHDMKILCIKIKKRRSYE